MALAIHASTSNGPNAASSASFAHDSGSGSDRLLVVRVGLFSAGETPTVSSVTYNGVACTKKVGAEHLYAGNTNVVRCEYWYLDDPTTGSNNVVVTLSGAGDALTAIATTYTGASGIGTNSNVGVGNLGTYSLAITTAAATSLLDGCYMGAASRGITAGSGVTEIARVTDGTAPPNNTIQYAGQKAATGGSDTWAVTLSSAVRSAAAVIEILEAAAAPSTFTASGTVTVGAISAAGVAASDAPTYSASGAAISAALVGSGTADHTAPVYTATGASTLTILTGIGAATHDAPVYSASGALAMPVLTSTGTATHSAPVYSATGASTLGALTVTGIATGSAPTFTASGAPTLGVFSATGAATFVPPSTLTLDISIATGTDDALQSPDGSITLGGASIRLDDVGEWGGFRFAGLTIPQGATIQSAYWEIERGPNSASPNVDIYAQDADNALTFAATTNDISDRPRTTAFVNWTATLGGVAGDRFPSPNIATVIQEVVDRPGWVSGNSLVIIADCMGGDVQIRTYNDAPGDAALLHVEYSTVAPGTFTATGTGDLAALTAIGTATFAAQTAHAATGAVTLPALTAHGTDVEIIGATPIGGLFLTVTRALVAEPSMNTATGTVTLGALSTTGSATHTVPIYAAAGAVTLGTLSASGNATHTAPVYTAAGTAALGALSVTGNATHTAPVYTAAGAPSLPGLSATGAATHTAPTFAASGAASLGVLTASGSGSFATSLFDASGAPTLAPLSATGSATFDAPLFTATGASSLSALTADGNATHDAPIYTATGAGTLGALDASGAASFAAAVYNATGAAILPLLSGSGTATYIAPIRTATGTLVLSVMTATGIVENTPSLGIGIGVISLPVLLAGGLATFGDTGPRITYDAEVEINLVAEAEVEMAMIMRAAVPVL